MGKQKAPRIPDSVVEGFREIDTACVGDVLVALGLNCITQGIHPLSPDMKVCGRALTVREISSRGKAGWVGDEVKPTALVTMAEPGDVLVFDIGGRLDAGPWGGNITLVAKQKGLAGTVIDGVCRDSEEIIAAGYPTFSRGIGVRHSHGLFRTTCVNSEPVQIGTPPFGIMVAPGDLVLGDAGGLCVVPAERASEILKLASARHELDGRIRALFLAGKGFGDPEIEALAAESYRLEGLVGATSSGFERGVAVGDATSPAQK